MEKQSIIPVERIQQSIYYLRGEKVMLDEDLAGLYGVDTKVLNQAVKRNIERFPSDFMFQLTAKETERLRSQIVTSKEGRGGRRYNPYAFTEQGVAMLSSVLRSKQAVEVNIAIMRTFVHLRKIMADNSLLRSRIEMLEKKDSHRDAQIQRIFDVLSEMIAEEDKPKKQIGYQSEAEGDKPKQNKK